MRTSHIPACQKANEDAWCGRISYESWRDTGGLDATWACSFVGVLLLAQQTENFNYCIVILENQFLELMHTAATRKMRKCHSITLWIEKRTKWKLSACLCRIRVQLTANTKKNFPQVHIFPTLTISCLWNISPQTVVRLMHTMLTRPSPFFLLLELNLERKSF